MNQYVEVIEQAVIVFPLMAAVITLPYLIYNYRKRGSVMSLRAFIVYSFILYLLCCYFLVILPLPSMEYAAQMTGPRVQLAPFTFVADIIREAHLASAGGIDDAIRSILTNRAFYQVIMNVLMFIPFGVYLRYYFRRSLKQTILWSLALSLFFELTQVSGLYFIYPRGYRLLDVDDLIVNTLGGAIGYFAAAPMVRFLPTRADMDQASYRRSQKVSLLRRMVALFCDFISMIAIAIIATIVLRLLNVRTPEAGVFTSLGVMAVGYFGVLPIFMNSQTIGHKLTRLQVARVRGGPAKWYQHIARIISVLLVFVLVPLVIIVSLVYMTNVGYVSPEGLAVLLMVVVAVYGFITIFELIRAAIRRPLFYERWTDTRLISTTSIKPRSSSDSKVDSRSDNGKVEIEGDKSIENDGKS